MKTIITAVTLVLLSVHCWSVFLAFQVNGFGLWGWIVGIGTFCLPFIAEFAWGIWAYSHGHPYLWGAVGFFLAMGIGGIANARRGDN